MIPARALNELTRVLSDTSDPVEIVLAGGRNQVLFHLEGIDLVSRLIDGQFPNYQQVVPKEHTTRAVLDREELLRAVRPAALIAHESANIVKLQVGGDGEAGITVSANAEVGDHVGQVEAAVEGDGTTIAFNARYLADVLTNVDAEQFALELNGPLSPGVFKPIGDDQLRPRRHARPDDLLATTGGRTGRDRTGATLLDSISLLDLRGYAALEAAFGPGPQLDLGPQRRGQDQPARGDRAAGLGPVAPHVDRRRADPLGRDLARVEGRLGLDAVEVAIVRSGADGSAGRKRIRVNGVGRRAGALGRPAAGRGLRPGGDAARRRLAGAAPRRARPARERHDRRGYASDARDVRPDPPAAQRAAAGDPRGERRRATSCASGTRPSSTPARGSSPTGCGSWSGSPARSPRPMPRSPPRRPRRRR